jgi:glycosyltransferase involved in cell wall biosynthesis
MNQDIGKTLSSITVVTALYNGEAYLHECMTSVAKSELLNNGSVEHIVVNDASTDRSIGVFERVAAELSVIDSYRPKLIDIEHTGRPSIVRNRGVRESSGDYLYFLDHDDVVMKHTLQTLSDLMQTKRCAFAYGNYVAVDPDLRYRLGSDYPGRPFEGVADALEFLFTKQIFQHAFMISRPLFSQIGGYSEDITFGEDFDICVRCVLQGHVPEFLPITVYLKRDLVESITHCYRESKFPRRAEHLAHFLRFRAELERLLPLSVYESIRGQRWMQDDTLPTWPLTLDEARHLAQTKPR